MPFILPRIKYVLPAAVLALTLVTSKAQSESGASSLPADGDELVQLVASKLRQHVSISANVRHRIHLFGQHLVGTGMYFQLRVEDRMLINMTLKTQLDDHQSSLQQVSDGTYHWIRRHDPDTTDLTRIDMRRVRDHLSRQELPSPQPLYSPAVNPGGLPAIVEQLLDMYEFGVAEPSTLYGVDVWEIRGTWRQPSSQDRKRVSSTSRKSSGSMSPDDVPHQVTLTLGCDDLFPYRWEYQDPFGSTLLSMLIYQVRINQPVDPNRFAFRPSSSGFKDGTDEYLEQIAVRHQRTVKR